MVAIVGKHECRRLEAARRDNDGTIRRHLNRDAYGGCIGVVEQHRDAHGPGRRAGDHRLCRPLCEDELGDAAIRACHRLLHDRHARSQDPLRAPRREVTLRRTTHCAQQVAPGRIAVRMAREETTDTQLECRVAHQVVQLPQHARRLVVDNRTVIALCLLQVVQRLPDRCRAGRGIGAVGHRLVVEVKGLPGIRRRRHVGLHLRRHVRRKALLEPEVIEPAHRHVVAEPLVRDLVVDRGLPAQRLRDGGPLAVDEALLVVEHRPRMLHAAERKCRREQKIILAEGIRHTEPVTQPAQRLRVHGDQRVGLRFLQS